MSGSDKKVFDFTLPKSPTLESIDRKVDELALDIQLLRESVEDMNAFLTGLTELTNALKQLKAQYAEQVKHGK